MDGRAARPRRPRGRPGGAPRDPGRAVRRPAAPRGGLPLRRRRPRRGPSGGPRSAAPQAAAPRVQYGDYAAWQRDALSSPAMRAQLARLRRTLADPPPPLELPVRTAPAAPSAQPGPRHGLVVEDLPAGLMDALHDLARAEGTEPFAIAFAAFAALLHRYGGATDLRVATPVTKLPGDGADGLLGALADPVVLRCDLGGDPSFRELAGRAAAAVREARAVRDYPYCELARLLARRGGGTLAHATFALDGGDPARPGPIDFGGLPATFAGHVVEPADTALNVVTAPGALLWEYDATAFDADDVARMAESHATLLRAALDAPATRVSGLPVLGGPSGSACCPDGRAAREARVPARARRRSCTSRSASRLAARLRPSRCATAT
ncbi:hypothetical protein GEV43_31575 [Actinomadura sp. J1-007]|nr:hypothetical protein [Actinomadura sp. J1-007]